MIVCTFTASFPYYSWAFTGCRITHVLLVSNSSGYISILYCEKYRKEQEQGHYSCEVHKCSWGKWYKQEYSSKRQNICVISVTSFMICRAQKRLQYLFRKKLQECGCFNISRGSFLLLMQKKAFSSSFRNKTKKIKLTTPQCNSEYTSLNWSAEVSEQELQITQTMLHF